MDPWASGGGGGGVLLPKEEPSYDDLQRLYSWVDGIPLTRPKRNIARDFSDGVLVAEVVKHFYPRLVELHNYSAANSLSQKMYNWGTLNNKVFRRLGFKLVKSDLEAVASCRPLAVERVLLLLQEKLASYTPRKPRSRRAGKAGGKTAGEAEGRRAARKPGVRARAGRGEGGRHAVEGGRGRGAAGRRRRDAGEREEDVDFGDEDAGVVAAVLGDDAVDDDDARAALPRRRRGDDDEDRRLPRTGDTRADVDTELLVEKEHEVQELRSTVSILELKIRKLEQLVRLKDSKIQTLTAKLRELTDDE